MPGVPQIKVKKLCRLRRIVRDIQEHRPAWPWLITRQERSSPVRSIDGHVLEVKAPFSSVAPVADAFRNRLLGPRPLLHRRKASFQVASLRQPHPIAHDVQASRPNSAPVLGVHTLLDHGYTVCSYESTQVIEGLFVVEHLRQASTKHSVNVRGTAVVQAKWKIRTMGPFTIRQIRTKSQTAVVWCDQERWLAPSPAFVTVTKDWKASCQVHSIGLSNLPQHVLWVGFPVETPKLCQDCALTPLISTVESKHDVKNVEVSEKFHPAAQTDDFEASRVPNSRALLEFRDLYWQLKFVLPRKPLHIPLTIGFTTVCETQQARTFCCRFFPDVTHNGPRCSDCRSASRGLRTGTSSINSEHLGTPHPQWMLFNSSNSCSCSSDSIWFLVHAALRFYPASNFDSNVYMPMNEREYAFTSEWKYIWKHITVKVGAQMEALKLSAMLPITGLVTLSCLPLHALHFVEQLILIYIYQNICLSRGNMMANWPKNFLRFRVLGIYKTEVHYTW